MARPQTNSNVGGWIKVHTFTFTGNRVSTAAGAADWTHIFENDVSYTLVLWPVCQELLQVTLVKDNTTGQQQNSEGGSHHRDTEHLDPGVDIVNVWDAAEYGFDFFLGQNGPPHLPLLLQRKLEKLKKKGKSSKALNSALKRS